MSRKKSDESDKNFVGEKIEQARRASGVKTKTALARKTGLTPNQISYFERGRHLPSVDQLDTIAEATGRSLSWFFRGEDSEELESIIAEQVEQYGRDVPLHLLRLSSLKTLEAKLHAAHQVHAEDQAIIESQQEEIERLKDKLRKHGL